MIIDKTYPLTKTVEYFGYLISVPVWASYVATDANGKVHAYETEPYTLRNGWVNHDIDTRAELIAHATLFKAPPVPATPEPKPVPEEQVGLIPDPVFTPEMPVAPPVEVQQDEDWTKTLIKVD